MANQMNFGQNVGVSVVKNGCNHNYFGGASVLNGLRGQFKVEHIRDGEVLDIYVFPNGITNEGKNKLFDVMFHGVTALATWYLGLIDTANYGGTGVQPDDQYTDIDGAGHDWDELQSYTDSNNSNNATTRPEWQEDGASGQSITNSTVSIYKMTGTHSVHGVFCCAGTQAQTKGDNTGGNTLWATALFAAAVPVVLNDELKVTYTVSA